MTYEDFSNILCNFGYSKTINTIGGDNYINHTFMSYLTNNKLSQFVSISYIIDSLGIVRQQFGSEPNIVELIEHKYDGTFNKTKFSFENCIRLLIERKYVKLQIVRDIYLEKLLEE